jgi:hypothetical protein
VSWIGQNDWNVLENGKDSLKKRKNFMEITAKIG